MSSRARIVPVAWGVGGAMSRNKSSSGHKISAAVCCHLGTISQFSALCTSQQLGCWSARTGSVASARSWQCRPSPRTWQCRPSSARSWQCRQMRRCEYHEMTPPPITYWYLLQATGPWSSSTSARPQEWHTAPLGSYVSSLRFDAGTQPESLPFRRPTE